MIRLNTSYKLYSILKPYRNSRDLITINYLRRITSIKFFIGNRWTQEIDFKVIPDILGADRLRFYNTSEELLVLDKKIYAYD